MSRITSLFFILVILFLYGCQNNQSQEIKVEDPLPFPTVLDTFNIQSFMNHFKEQNPQWLSTADYTFNYIGHKKDSIFILPYISFNSSSGESLNPLMIPTKKYYLEYGEKRNYKTTAESAIEIRINTGKKIAGYYPIMLTNIDSDTCFIGSENSIPMIMEARDKQGKWKPIQQYYGNGCRTGVGYIFLPPNHIAITLAPIFKGDYKTRLRLKYGKNYSKPFEGNIHYSQFEYELRSHYPY